MQKGRKKKKQERSLQIRAEKNIQETSFRLECGSGKRGERTKIRAGVQDRRHAQCGQKLTDTKKAGTGKTPKTKEKGEREGGDRLDRTFGGTEKGDIRNCAESEKRRKTGAKGGHSDDKQTM